MRHVPDIERRSRLVRRHALGPHRLTDPLAATESVVCLHATEPATVYLSLAVRAEGVTADDVHRLLYDDRSLVKQLAMRRTLFAFPRDLLPAVWGSASARVAEQERKRVAKDAVAAGLTDDGDAWLEEARERVLALLREHGQLGAQQIREGVPMLDAKVGTSTNPDAKWAGPVQIAPRVLTWLGARGDLVRGVNGGHWRTSRPQWTAMQPWLGEEAVPLPEAEGYTELVRRWLARFGPGTENDVVWWLGATKAAVRRAFADLGAVEVALDGGATGWLLPDDLEQEEPVDPAALLLPVLDPTTMGWKDRDFYLDPDLTPYLFDSNGNGGTTAWWDGRVVGAWVQDDEGRVEVLLREDPGRDARRALDLEAERLTGWLDGQVISSVYKSRLMKGEPLP
ncbi:winged helix DNA-binding domain-containing protein [Nocardioides aestuarii]|uniref:Winged helix DNA-binding domain-containing protein n=1 Tax=Nocardioides aestuarii TaxID=252231 RepID=A0ABW4TID7_9ACTN